MRRHPARGTLGPVRERRVPSIPPGWRLPAVALTVIVCAAIFVVAVVIGIR